MTEEVDGAVVLRVRRSTRTWQMTEVEGAVVGLVWRTAAKRW
jgi:hypothetical protein